LTAASELEANRKEYSVETIRQGKITVAPEVILDIIRQAALYTEGVVGMASIPPRVDRIFRRLITGEGIALEILDDSVTIDLYLVAEQVDLLNLGHRVQREVIRSVDRLVGLKVSEVNIHIQDVAYPGNAA
jgi:uncharacterized alkaline shock family protein YloU